MVIVCNQSGSLQCKLKNKAHLFYGITMIRLIYLYHEFLNKNPVKRSIINYSKTVNLLYKNRLFALFLSLIRVGIKTRITASITVNRLNC